MRLKSEIWVQAYLRICASQGLFAVLVKRGDPDAGAIFVRVLRLDGSSDVYGPASAGRADADAERRYTARFASGPIPDQQADAYLAQQRAYDPDLWVIEVEDRAGRHCLGDWVVRD